jgi:hypothetical protein
VLHIRLGLVCGGCTREDTLQTYKHKEHLTQNTSWNSCPECRADTSRRFTGMAPFLHSAVPTDVRHKYYAYVKARIDAIRTGENGGNTVEARQWYRYEFMRALHRRISSHLPQQTGRKHAPNYAKYHLATYGSDWNFVHDYGRATSER